MSIMKDETRGRRIDDGSYLIRSTKVSADDVSGAVGEQLDLLRGGGFCVDPHHVLGAAWTHEATPSTHPTHRDGQLCL